MERWTGSSLRAEVVPRESHKFFSRRARKVVRVQGERTALLASVGRRTRSTARPSQSQLLSSAQLRAPRQARRWSPRQRRSCRLQLSLLLRRPSRPTRSPPTPPRRSSVSPLLESDPSQSTVAASSRRCGVVVESGKAAFSEWASKPAQSTAGFPPRGEPARGARVRPARMYGHSLLRRIACECAGRAGAVHASGGAGIDSPSKTSREETLEVNNSRAGESSADCKTRSYASMSIGGRTAHKAGTCRAGRSERVQSQGSRGGCEPRGTSTNASQNDP